jgi:predicted type IV restriction endonuclease
MPKVSKRFLERAKGSLRKYQRAFEAARSRDVNESDTCVILSDFLSDVLGYDKYSEVTTEFAVRTTFCDLAIKIDGSLQYLIEVKSVGTELKDNHLRQAVDYAANQGIEWVLLTNGPQWRAFRIRFEKPIQADEVFSLDLLDPDAKPGQLLEKLYLISREAAGNAAIASYWQQKEATNRYVIAQLMLDEASIKLTRRQLRRLFPGTKVEAAQIGELLRNEILKREVIEGERALAAERIVRRASRRRQRSKGATPVETTAPSAEVVVPSPVIVPAGGARGSPSEAGAA